MANSSPAECVRLYLDSERFGSGWRFFVLFDHGRLNCTVFHPASLKGERMSTAMARGGRPVDLSPYEWRRLAKRIEDRRRAFKRQGVPHRTKLVNRAVLACRHRAAGTTSDA